MFKVEYNPETMIKTSEVAELFKTDTKLVRKCVENGIIPKPYAYIKGTRQQIWGRKQIMDLHKERGGMLPKGEITSESQQKVLSFLSMPAMAMVKKKHAPVKKEHLG